MADRPCRHHPGAAALSGAQYGSAAGTLPAHRHHQQDCPARYIYSHTRDSHTTSWGTPGFGTNVILWCRFCDCVCVGALEGQDVNSAALPEFQGHISRFQVDTGMIRTPCLTLLCLFSGASVTASVAGHLVLIGYSIQSGIL